MGPYAGVDYNLTLCRLQSRLGGRQPYAKVDLNPMPEWTLSHSQGLRIWPLLCSKCSVAIYVKFNSFLSFHLYLPE
jgi:hypothetical protein